MASGSVVVFHIETMAEQIFTCPAREAVVCAHEQSRNNYNTRDYNYGKARYSLSGDMVKCGLFAAAVR